MSRAGSWPPRRRAACVAEASARSLCIDVLAELDQELACLADLTRRLFRFGEDDRFARQRGCLFAPLARESAREIQPELAAPQRRVAVVDEIDRRSQVPVAGAIAPRHKQEATHQLDANL